MAPLDEIVYPKLNKEVAGLRFVPEGDNCLRSTEMATPVGLALAKGDPVFHNWLTAVEKEMHQRLEDGEIRIVKEGEK